MIHDIPYSNSTPFDIGNVPYNGPWHVKHFINRYRSYRGRFDKRFNAPGPLILSERNIPHKKQTNKKTLCRDFFFFSIRLKYG